MSVAVFVLKRRFLSAELASSAACRQPTIQAPARAKRSVLSNVSFGFYL
ncbi:hypothetical protein U91I_00865 [alpha proteobacterium U9-1i]|nr:hypothetical protein U91I_00865 [alpha proteobacterium U9-1i]